ncbi:NADH dehydrogenase [ubiquinone] 1 beta subcomplex subunit 5, mitochondrial-like [Glandiceps talaboti]
MAASASISRLLQVNRLKVPLERCNLLLQQSSRGTLAPIISRGMAGGFNKAKFIIQPSKYSDNRFIRLLRTYTLVTVVPATIVITFINVFIGEAQYAEIPEGYRPEHWEYHKHPITRFLAKHFCVPPQKDYEKMISYLDEETDKQYLRSQEEEVKKLIKERGDDGHWYYYPTPSLADYGDSVKNLPP